MNPLIPLVLVIGAFLLGRQGRKSAPAKKSGLRGLPPPPTEDPLEGALALPPAPLEEIKDRWVGVTYDVEFYPAEDGTVPPPGEIGIMANPACTTIAVGAGWWDVAGNFAAAAKSEDPKAIYRDIVTMYLPQCALVDTLGAQLFRAELMARIEEMFPAVDPGPLGSSIGVTAVPQPVQPAESAQYHYYQDYTILLEPRKVYHPALGQTATTWDWRVWAPGAPITIGTAIIDGSNPEFLTALTHAQNAISLASLSMNGPRRNGRARMARKAPKRSLRALSAR